MEQRFEVTIPIRVEVQEGSAAEIENAIKAFVSAFDNGEQKMAYHEYTNPWDKKVIVSPGWSKVTPVSNPKEGNDE